MRLLDVGALVVDGPSFVKDCIAGLGKKAVFVRRREDDAEGGLGAADNGATESL